NEWPCVRLEGTFGKAMSEASDTERPPWDFVAHEAFYPESIRLISDHLSALVGTDFHSLQYFRAHFPPVIDQVISFFESVHSAHERAVALLNSGARYCLYLRDFAAAGYRGEFYREGGSVKQRLGISTIDGDFETGLVQALNGVIPVVS